MKRIILIIAFALYASQVHAFTAAERFLMVASNGCTLPDTVSQGTLTNNPAQLTVSWITTTGATSYNVYYSLNSGLTGTFDGISAYSGQTSTSGKYTGLEGTSYNINGPLTASTTYYTRVAGVNSCGTGILSGPQSLAAAAKPYVSDNFNRADGGLGDNWTTITGYTAPQITSNVVAGNNVGMTAANYNVTLSNNQYAKAGVISLSSDDGEQIGVKVRSSNTANTSYSAWLQSSGTGNMVYLYKFINGTGTSLGASSGDGVTSIQLTANGTTISVDDCTASCTQIISATDSSIVGGNIGIYVNSYDYESLDDFSGGDL